MSDPAMPPLRLLAMFAAVVRTGGIQRAAADLNVSQPAVSQSLRALEAMLGTRLFDRGVRPVALTPAGQVLAHGVRDGMAHFGRAVADVRALARRNEAAVTIACTLGTATYWLMPRLAGFHAAHPEIAVNVRTAGGMAALAPDVDLAIRYGAGVWPEVSSQMLFGEWVVPVCHPALAAGDALARLPLLHVDSDEAGWLGWADWFARTGEQRPPRPGDRHFSNYVQATQAALAGQGAMLGWYSNAGDLIREGRLVPLAAAPLYPDAAFHLVEPHRPRSPAAERFRRWLLTGPGAAARQAVADGWARPGGGAAAG